MAAHAAESADLLRRLGIERARVLAHSSGCVFALQLALDHPELVDHLATMLPDTRTTIVPGENHLLPLHDSAG